MNMSSLRSIAVGSGIYLLTIINAIADDIDVYGASGFGAGARLPNVLFVFDTSASMRRTVDGNVPSIGEPTKLQILQGVIANLLDSSEGRVNVGITSFNNTSHGIKWPVSNLLQPASEIDSAIQSEILVKDVVQNLINRQKSSGSTATVDALVEAAKYFRSEDVWISGISNIYANAPPYWSPLYQRYVSGAVTAAIPVSYSPEDAYQFNASKEEGGESSCYDYSIGGTITSGRNFCEGKEIVRCDDPAGSTVEWDPTYCGVDNPSYEWVCNEYDVTGTECVSGTSSCSSPGGEVGRDAAQKCYFEEESRNVDVWRGAAYNSPIGQTCQANYIVLLSDGAPSVNSAKSTVTELTGNKCDPLSSSIFNIRDGSYNYGDCGPELVEYLNNNNQLPTIDNSTVSTFTVGFGLGAPGSATAQDYLKLLANRGGGKFIQADNPDELTKGFNQIIDEIAGGAQTGSSISIDTNPVTGAHLDKGYFNLFQPSAKNLWDGNLKGYFLRGEGLHDQNNRLATEIKDGEIVFKDSSQSFWSSSADGNVVVQGGANNLINNSNRRFVSNLRENFGEYDLTDPSNQLELENINVTPGLFGPYVQAEDLPSLFSSLNNAPMGAAMHSKPIAVQYEDQNVVFTMTNQGMLHAFDAEQTSSRGIDRELFVFIPRDLLTNVQGIARKSYTGKHIYGLDGDIVHWHDDSVKADGIVNPGERVVLFMGMRRGGNAYYALDVSRINEPRLLWKIDPSVAGFERLGQTWSRPSVVSLSWQGETRKMLVFGGGYDVSNDSSEIPDRAATQSGNALYFVDPLSGSLMWSISNAEADTNVSSMKFSIPSDLRIIDVDDNSVADRIYTGDTAGNIWRIKLDEQNFGRRNGVEVTHFANLGTNDPTGDRRFFYPPTAYFSSRVPDRYLSLTIGSGDRASPFKLHAVNRIYTLRDSDTETAILGQQTRPLQPSDLLDADQIPTNENGSSGSASEGVGWFLNLGYGEKALSPVVAFEGRLLFTTYAPKLDPKLGAVSPECAVVGSTGRYYSVTQETGAPVPSSSTQARTARRTSAARLVSRSRQVAYDGILGPPVVILPEGSDSASIFVDKLKLDSVPLGISRFYWHAR